MQWSELGAKEGCKDHPNDKQLPGVCSSCLRDKLSKLYYCNNTTTLIDPLCCSPSSPASPQAQAQAQAQPQPFSHASDTSLNYVSPAYRRHLHRNASHAASSVSCMLSFNYELNLKKSKSLAFASRNRLKERDVGGGRGRKKDGFWSKVLKLTRKDTKEAFMNSKKAREGQAHGFSSNFSYK